MVERLIDKQLLAERFRVVERDSDSTCDTYGL